MRNQHPIWFSDFLLKACLIFSTFSRAKLFEKDFSSYLFHSSPEELGAKLPPIFSYLDCSSSFSHQEATFLFSLPEIRLKTILSRTIKVTVKLKNVIK